MNCVEDNTRGYDELSLGVSDSDFSLPYHVNKLAQSFAKRGRERGNAVTPRDTP